jgi:hypothetical protein
MNELDIEDDFLELYGDYIYIPEQTVFWRGFHKEFAAVSDRPAYYSSLYVARGYYDINTHILGSFINTRKLKLLDIRFMRVLLRNLLQDVVSLNNIKNNNYIKMIDADKINNNQNFLASLSTNISFGLCSLNKQIELFRKYINNNPGQIDELEKIYKEDSLIEQEGVRIAVTNIDLFTMTFLKNLFEDFVDGFISPRLKTPYHTEKKGTMSPEMIIFNPIKSGIKLFYLTKELPKININKLILQNKPIITNMDFKKYKSHFFMTAGGYRMTAGGYSQHPLDIFEIEFNKKNKNVLKIYNTASAIGKKWRYKYFNYFLLEPPVQSIKATIFENKSYIPTKDAK